MLTKVFNTSINFLRLPIAFTGQLLTYLCEIDKKSLENTDPNIYLKWHWTFSMKVKKNYNPLKGFDKPFFYLILTYLTYVYSPI